MKENIAKNEEETDIDDDDDDDLSDGLVISFRIFSPGIDLCVRVIVCLFTSPLFAKISHIYIK
jgi:hypothetical protein